MTLTAGEPTTPPLQVSKWNQCCLLIDSDELQALFADLPAFSLHPLGQVIDDPEISLSELLILYKAYIETLRSGSERNKGEWGRQFSLALTVDQNALFTVPLGEGRFVVRPKAPIVQLQHHQFHYSREDGKVRSGVVGNTVSWGLQLSFPQLWMGPDGQIVTLRKEDPTGNAVLFRSIQRWVRKNTRPLILEHQEERVTTQVRIGPSCLDWIDRHAELQQQQLVVVS
jgi:hypothetical protein